MECAFTEYAAVDHAVLVQNMRKKAVNKRRNLKPPPLYFN